MSPFTEENDSYSTSSSSTLSSEKEHLLPKCTGHLPIKNGTYLVIDSVYKNNNTLYIESFISTNE